MKIILFVDHWDQMWRRRQQIAWLLSQEKSIEHVLFIERPLTLTSLINLFLFKSDETIRERWVRFFKNFSWKVKINSKITLLTPFSILPKTTNEKFEKKVLKKIQSFFNNDKVYVYYSYHYFSPKLIKKINPIFFWYDITEDFSSWPLNKEQALTIKNNDNDFTKNANLVSVVSTTLFEEKKSFNKNVHFIPNAINLDLFKQKNKELPFEFKEIKNPILTHLGYVVHWGFEMELLKEVATKQPNWSFIFIGPIDKNRKNKLLNFFSKNKNIHFIGMKKYIDIHNYIYYSDVCFMFYKNIRSKKTCNSQKIFAYLAEGKPVVSTPSADALLYKDFIHLAKTSDEFIQKVQLALKENDPNLIKKRIEFAEQNSWSKRKNLIMKLIKNEHLKI